MCSATMRFGNCRFNLYFAILLASALGLCGCKTAGSKEPTTTLRINTEAKDDSSFTRTIKVYKDESLKMRVHEVPLVSHVDLEDAQVVEVLGGFAIRLQFNSMGRWQIDHYTSINIGRHFAIYVLYGKKPAVSRWIAAPIISDRISDGVILFTPDATREEAELIVKGLPHKETSKPKPGILEEDEEEKE